MLLDDPQCLAIPAALTTEVQRNGADPEVLAELRDLYRTAWGYEFSWGQVIESFDRGSDGMPSSVQWDFILVRTLSVFHQKGGNLGELSDCCTSVLNWMAETIRRDRPEEFRRDVLPDCVVFTEGGSKFAAFGVEAQGQDAIDITRSWLQSYFIPAVLPLVMYQVESS